MTEKKPFSADRPFAGTTAGLLIEGLDDGFQSAIYRGVAETLGAHNVSLVSYSGGTLTRNRTDEFDFQRNLLFNLVKPGIVDGLIVAGWLGNNSSPDAFESFLDRFHPLPMVSIGRISPSIPCVEIDNTEGMMALTGHLIETHGVKRFAYLGGPADNKEAQDRYQAFTGMLKKHSILLNPQMLFRGKFTRNSGVQTVEQLLRLPVNLPEVIVCANDDMALGVMETLEKHGVRVPYDVMVTGFDGIDEARQRIPRLTTVIQPLYDLGAAAARGIIDAIAGKTVPAQTLLPSGLDINHSCGCFRYNRIRDDAQAGEENNAETRQHLIEAALKLMPSDSLQVPQSRLLQLGIVLYQALYDVTAGKISENDFLKQVDIVVRNTIKSGLETQVWQRPMLFMASYIRVEPSGALDTARLESCLHMAQMFIADTAQSAQASVLFNSRRETMQLGSFDDSLAVATTRSEILETFQRFLPLIPVKRCCINLYEKHNLPDRDVASLLYYDGTSCVPGNAALFPGCRLLPPDCPVPAQPAAIAVEALSFRNEAQGFVVFQMDPRDVWLTSRLRGMVSSAVKSVQLYENMQKQSADLSAANRQLMNLRAQEQEYMTAVKRELKTAQQIQSDFLPTNLPEAAGWDIGVFFKPAQEVAGDFYDAFFLDDTRLCLVIADVCGKSVGAALFMALIRSLVRALSEQSRGTDGVAIVNFVNDYIMRNHHQHGPFMFATLFYGVLDIASGDLSYVNAGHYAPLLASGGVIRKQLKPTGPAIGIHTFKEYTTGFVTMEPGELLFMYTDGVTESKGPVGEIMSNDTLFSLVSKPYTAAQASVESVWHEIRRHLEGLPLGDDITMVSVIRKNNPV